MIYLLKLRYIPQGYNTIEKIINHWNPPGNPNYVSFVATTTGIPANQTISATNEHEIKSIVQAIARYENGQTVPGTPEVITDLQYATARNNL